MTASRRIWTILAVTLVAAPAVAADSADWSAGTAYTLERGRTEVGVFAPLRYGWTDDVELATHPLADLLMPNLAVKVGWGEHGAVTLASRHALSYPTGLYHALARQGVGGLVPNDSAIPHIIALNTEGLATWKPSSKSAWWLTGKLGVMIAGRVGEMNLATIDLPVLFARTAAHHKGWSVNVGLDADGRLAADWSWFVDLDVFLLSTPSGRYAFEQSSMIAWHLSQTLRVLVGYKITYADYPFGPEWNLGNSWVPLPMVDVQWAL